MRKEIELKNRDRFIALGITISYYRKLRGMTQEQLAERVGIGCIEAPNCVQSFSLDILYGIADALDISPSDLLNTAYLTQSVKSSYYALEKLCPHSSSVGIVILELAVRLGLKL